MKEQRAAKRRSIRMDMLISHISLAMLVILLASTLCYILTYHCLREQMLDELSRQAVYIAQADGDDDVLLPSRVLAQTYRKLTDAFIFYVNMQGESISMQRYNGDGSDTASAHTKATAEVQDFVPIDDFDNIDRALILRVLDGETIADIDHYAFADGVFLIAGAPVYDQTGEIIGGVILAQPVTIVNSLSRTIMLLVLCTAGLSILLALLISMQLCTLLVRPIKRITQVARAMTKGNYAGRVENLPDNEVGEMGEALNSMAERLTVVIETLFEEKSKLEMVLSNIGEGVLAVDEQRNIVHGNQTFLELAEIGCTEELCAWESANARRVLALLEGCMADGQSRSEEWRGTGGRAIMVSACPLSGGRGESEGALCLMRDVSEEQRMEQLRRDYVANISHELRTPLTGIRGMVEPLMDGCMETEAERQDCYRVILKETVRLQKMVGEMLDMSRLQDGRVRLELERLELPGILAAAARSVRKLADAAEIQLGVETDGSTLECLGNEDRIEQVLVILLDNALSFTPSGGRVTIFARDCGSRVELGVRDTGVGIEPKDLPMIWERFYKVDKSRMRTTGTGLGLSIAKILVELMGGSIRAESEVGRGSTFTFTLNK